MRHLQRLPLHGRLSPRNRLLPLGALLLLVLLAGCSAPGSADLEPVTDADIADRASRSIGASTVQDGDDPEVRVLRSALENGSGTIEATSPPVSGGLPFEYRGSYYDLTRRVVDERTETSVSLVVDYNASDPDGRRVAYEDLPPADRRLVDALLPPRPGPRDDGYDFGAAARYNDTEVERSAFAPEQRYDVVVYEGEAYPVALDGTREVTVKTYRYTSTKVADGPDEYARDLKEEHLFTLNGLSEAEREVVQAAIEEGYHAESDDDEAFESVVERFRRHEPVEGEEGHGEWLVRYDGTVYWAELRYDGFV